MTDVLCAFIYNNLYQILLTKRPKKRDIGKWEFPGGKVKFGESFENETQREIDKELGIQTKLKNNLKTIIKGKFKLQFVECMLLNKISSIELKEHNEIKFIDLNSSLDLVLTSGEKGVL